jgi:acetylornithine deacetylase/succinyl-diaminopimelate desuccinylase-like protein
VIVPTGLARDHDTARFCPMPNAATAIFDKLEPARRRLAQRANELLDLQIAIASVPAPTGDEGARAAFIAARLADALPNVDIDAAGNVVGRLAASRDGEPPVVLCAHLDTVFPHGTDLSVTRDGPRVSAPGIGDNARGLVALVALAEELSNGVSLARSVVFAATTGEEGAGDLRGARHLFGALGDDIQAVIALDGPGDTRIVTEALGVRRMRARIRGPGGHSWGAFGVVNPVHVAGAITVDLAGLKLPAEPRVTVSVNRIGGGSSINAIPEEAWLEVEVRSIRAAELERWEMAVDARMRHVVERANASRPEGTGPLTLTSERIGQRPSGAMDPAHPLVAMAREATAIVGRTAELAAASTDANVPMSRGVPAIAIGAGGRGGDTHTLREWYDHTESSLGLARALTIVAAAASA